LEILGFVQKLSYGVGGGKPAVNKRPAFLSRPFLRLFELAYEKHQAISDYQIAHSVAFGLKLEYGFVD